jgi:hypothetical protein
MALPDYTFETVSHLEVAFPESGNFFSRLHSELQKVNIRRLQLQTESS